MLIVVLSKTVTHVAKSPPTDSHNLPLRCEPDSPFAPTETLKIAPLPRAALQRSGARLVSRRVI
jgi:hypothetical protein